MTRYVRLLRTMETKVDEILLRLIGGTLVKHATSVDDKDLVHELIDTLTSLIQGDEGGTLAHVRHYTQRLGVIESGASIETTRGVIPAGDRRLGSERLGNTDTFPLTTRNAANKRVADQGVPRVNDAKHLEKRLSNDGDTALFILACLVHEGEAQRLPDGERREMLIVFRVIVHLATEPFVLFRRRNTAIRDFPVDAGKSIAVIGNGFEERGASGPGTSQDEHHLALAQGTGEIVDEIVDGRLPAQTQLRNESTEIADEIRAERAHDGIGQCPDEGSAGLDAVYREVLEDDSDALGRLTGGSAPFEMATHQKITQVEAGFAEIDGTGLILQDFFFVCPLLPGVKTGNIPGSRLSQTQLMPQVLKVFHGRVTGDVLAALFGLAPSALFIITFHCGCGGFGC